MPTRTSTVKKRGKGVVKRKAQKKTVKRKLVAATPECCFFVHEGPVIKNLKELHSALELGISNEQYTYHTSKGVNDFSEWIDKVLCDPLCAKVLARVKTRKTAVAKVKICLKNYK